MYSLQRMLDSTVNLTNKVVRQPRSWIGLLETEVKVAVTNLTLNMQNISLEYVNYVSDTFRNVTEDSVGECALSCLKIEMQ